MTNKNEPVDLDFSKATEVTPGEPVEHPSLSLMGGTFAERAAAAKKAEKAVKSDDAEDKAVSSASTKSRKPARKQA